MTPDRQMDQEDARLLCKLADELYTARDHLESLGNSLCSDPHVVGNFAADLQLLDQVAQLQACIADVLRAANIQKKASDIPLEALNARIKAG